MQTDIDNDDGMSHSVSHDASGSDAGDGEFLAQSETSTEQPESDPKSQVDEARLHDKAQEHQQARAQSAEFAALAKRVAQSQDKDAFEHLFDHFAPRLKAYLLRLGAGEMQAEELVQEVMITLWRKAEMFDPAKSSLATWLFRIARNRRIDAIRKEQRADLDPDDPSLQPAGEADVGELLDAQLRDERVRASLTQLPEEQLELIRLSFFKGLSHSQISEETGLPLGTVKSRIRLAFTRLRRTLEADDAVDLVEDGLN